MYSSSSATFPDNQSKSIDDYYRDHVDHDDMNNNTTSHNADATVNIMSSSKDGDLQLWRLQLHSAAPTRTTKRDLFHLMYDTNAKSAVGGSCMAR